MEKVSAAPNKPSAALRVGCDSCLVKFFSVPSRIELRLRDAGHFFERVPTGPDAYILRVVIRDCSDADAVRILKTVREAAKSSGLRAWLDQLSARTHRNVATVALANKLARMAWAVLANQEEYRPPVLASPTGLQMTPG